MKTETLTNETLRKYIPNVLTEVEGETPLATKLAPFIDTARQWIEAEYLGPDDFLSDAHNELALKIVVAKAFAMAVPSLDLMLTPTGFGVISSDNMVPASKERIERLIASLNSYVDANVAVLVGICRTYEEWRNSERGQYFCSTFLCSPDDTNLFREDHPYSWVHENAATVELVMADDYLGHDLMATLREANASKDMKYFFVCRMIREAIVAIIQRQLFTPVDTHPVWHRCRYIINELNSYPELKAVWEAEMGEKFKVAGFVNDIKGGFYF